MATSKNIVNLDASCDSDGDVFMLESPEKGEKSKLPKCSTPKERIPSFRAKLVRRPLNLKAPRPLKMKDSGIVSPGLSVIGAASSHKEDSWELNKTFQSEDSSCTCGTQTSNAQVSEETELSNLVR